MNNEKEIAELRADDTTKGLKLRDLLDSVHYSYNGTYSIHALLRGYPLLKLIAMLSIIIAAVGGLYAGFSVFDNFELIVKGLTGNDFRYGNIMDKAIKGVLSVFIVPAAVVMAHLTLLHLIAYKIIDVNLPELLPLIDTKQEHVSIEKAYEESLTLEVSDEDLAHFIAGFVRTEQEKAFSEKAERVSKNRDEIFTMVEKGQVIPAVS